MEGSPAFLEFWNVTWLLDCTLWYATSTLIAKKLPKEVEMLTLLPTMSVKNLKPNWPAMTKTTGHYFHFKKTSGHRFSFRFSFTDYRTVVFIFISLFSIMPVKSNSRWKVSLTLPHIVLYCLHVFYDFFAFTLNHFVWMYKKNFISFSLYLLLTGQFEGGLQIFFSSMKQVVKKTKKNSSFWDFKMDILWTY